MVADDDTCLEPNYEMLELTAARLYGRPITAKKLVRNKEKPIASASSSSPPLKLVSSNAKNVIRKAVTLVKHHVHLASSLSVRTAHYCE